MDIRKALIWIANYIQYIGVWTFFLYAGTAAIYYVHFEIYKNQGVQMDALGSSITVILVIIGSLILTRKVFMVGK